jgi:hypothetical protein
VTAVPRHHTPRDPSRRTLGRKLGKLAAAMGTPLMPWQQSAADVALELDADGRFAYKRIVITVPRQAGKTTMTLALGLHRMLTTPNGKVWTTAQTGQAAREHFIGDLVPAAQTLLGTAVVVKRGAGDTRMILPALGSQMRPHPPNDEYLHGEQSDLNMVDEPWALSEVKADALIQAFLPTQATRPNAQTVWLSTMGDAGSTFWHRMVDEARSGEDPRTCIFDWGLPEAADPTDVEAVIAAHPAVGYTIEPDVIRDAHAAMKPAEFARAYANHRTATRVAVFDADTLRRVMSETATMAAGSPVSFGVATSWDRSRSVIAAAGRDANGSPVVEIVDARPGSGWVAERLAALDDHHHPLGILVDGRSPASTIAADPSLEKIVTVPDSRAVAAGTASFLDHIAAGTMHLTWDAELSAAFDVLTLRVVGDLGQMIDRKHSAGSVAHVEAAMLALTGLQQAPPPAPEPMIWSMNDV